MSNTASEVKIGDIRWACEAELCEDWVDDDPQLLSVQEFEDLCSRWVCVGHHDSDVYYVRCDESRPLSLWEPCDGSKLQSAEERYCSSAGYFVMVTVTQASNFAESARAAVLAQVAFDVQYGSDISRRIRKVANQLGVAPAEYEPDAGDVGVAAGSEGE